MSPAAPRAVSSQFITGWSDQTGGVRVSDVSFRACTFEKCHISVSAGLNKPIPRSTFERIEMQRCRARWCAVWSPIVIDSTFEDVKTGETILYSPALRRVTMRGRFDNVFMWIRGKMDPVPTEDALALERDNEAFYAATDWALDICNATFSDLSIRSVPAHLVRTNGIDQCVVTSDTAFAGRWAGLPLHQRSYARMILEEAANGGNRGAVIVAPRRSRFREGLLHDIRLLREAGLTLNGPP